jgi:hypothetical protein
MTTVKMLLNSIISTKDSRYMTGNLKDFFLGTPLDRYEYICIPLKIIPQTSSICMPWTALQSMASYMQMSDAL